jgi:hypothetical protein
LRQTVVRVQATVPGESIGYGADPDEPEIEGAHDDERDDPGGLVLEISSGNETRRRFGGTVRQISERRRLACGWLSQRTPCRKLYPKYVAAGK